MIPFNSNKRDVIVHQGTVYEYPGKYIDSIFIEIIKTSVLVYGGKITHHDGEYHWYYGDPDDPDEGVRDDKGEYLPILSCGDMETLRFNVDYRSDKTSQSHKLGSEIGVSLDS